MLAESFPDVVLLDLGLPDGDGAELLRDEQLATQSEIVVMTGNATVESAVLALRGGSLHYPPKPIDVTRPRPILAGGARARQDKTEGRGARGGLRQLGPCRALVG